MSLWIKLAEDEKITGAARVGAREGVKLGTVHRMTNLAVQRACAVRQPLLLKPASETSHSMD
jgi:hypothetical protein